MVARDMVDGCRRTARSLAELRGAERRLYTTAWWALFVSRVRLRFPRLLRGRALLRLALAEETARDTAPVPLARLAAVFQRARADHPFPSSCLPRAVALQRFLRSHGVAARLSLGLRRENGELSGHAWVTCDGRPVNDSPGFVRRYSQLSRARG